MVKGKKRLKSLGTTDEATAQAKAKELSNGGLGKLFNDYISKLVASKSPSDWRVDICRDHFLRLLPSVRADDLNAQHLKDYASKRREEGVLDNTIYDEISYLRTALRHAGLNTPQLPFEKPKRRRREVVLPMQMVRDAFNWATGWFKTFLMLATHTTARKEAILELVWERVDFVSGTIDFNNPADTMRRKPRAVVKMSDTLRTYLWSIKEAKGPVVRGENGKRLINVSKQYANLREALEEPRISAHVIRHSIASHMVMQGVPMKEVSVFLGHANVKITEDTYAKFLPEFQNKSTAFLDEFMK